MVTTSKSPEHKDAQADNQEEENLVQRNSMNVMNVVTLQELRPRWDNALLKEVLIYL